jgi:hypothetical protein
MVAGTSSMRTTLASSAIAMTMPMPIILMKLMPEAENEPMTTSSNRAALVTTGAVACSPLATASSLFPPASHASRMRLSRNIS